ncbi:MAG: GspE/PulE family protein [Patescibacteria group bacterium]|nr:GspE/PulE family protein [Patescibacteria group bacterium]
MRYALCVMRFMSQQNVQSIADLIASSHGEPMDDEAPQAKLAQNEKEIKIKELERITQSKANSLGLPYINLFGFPVGPEALMLITEEDAEKLSTVCFYYNGKNIRLASLYPQDAKIIKKLEELKAHYYCNGNIHLTSQYSIEYALKLYKLLPKIKETIRGISITEEDLDKYSAKFSSFYDVQKQINNVQISDIITVLMASSIKAGSSDIHIEAEEKEIKVRFRIDGILHDVAVLEKVLWEKIISRLKGLAKVKINITDKPQDGRISIHTKKERIDIRASFLPTNYGESVVMRLLRSSSIGLAFEDLGLKGRAFNQLKREVERPNGMIITTGPTGSGKTTTLYAILKKLNSPETKIITVEDPIEYQLNGVNQSQVGKEYTFAKALRSIVRQDPDIIMVGEIRDLETVEVSIQAALTGHLVLSTIHTNSAAGAIPRFLSMGAESFLLAPAINAIVGQRLTRKICKKCKQEEKLDKEKAERVNKILETLPEEYKKDIDFNNLKFYKGTGCEACQNIGYKGRIGIYEIMTMSNEIEQLILSNKLNEYDILKIALKQGMITMVQDGLLKVLDGITSVDEIFRVVE